MSWSKNGIDPGGSAGLSGSILHRSGAIGYFGLHLSEHLSLVGMPDLCVSCFCEVRGEPREMVAAVNVSIM